MRNQRLDVGDGKDIAIVEATELLPGRLDISLADDARCLAADHNRLDFVATGHNANVTRVDDFGEIGVVLAGSVLGDVAIDGDKVTDSDVSESIATEDVDTVIISRGSSRTKVLMKAYLSEVRSWVSGSGERIQKPLGPLAVTRPATS